MPFFLGCPYLQDLRMPTGNGLNHNFSIKEQNVREDLLHQVRSKACSVLTLK